MKFELKSIFVKTLLIILAVSFVLFGVVNFFTGMGSANIIKVGNKKVSVAKFSRYLMERRSQYYQSNPTEADLDFFNSKEFVNSILSEFVGEMLFQNEVEKLNLTEPREAVLYEITNDKNFQTPSGEFNVKLFKSLLQRSNITEDMYIQYVSLLNSRNALVNLLISGTFVNDFMLEPLFKSANKYVVADIITIKQNDIKFDSKEPTHDEIEKYYDDNMSEFIVPEEKIISSVEIDLNDYNSEESKNKLSEFEDVISTSSNIDEVVNKLNLEKQTFTYKNNIMNIPNDLPIEFLQYGKGVFSGIVYNDNNIYRVYYIEEIIPSRTLTSKEATPQIIEILKEKAKKENDLIELDRIIKQMESANIDRVAMRNGAELLKNQNIYKNNLVYPDEFTRQIFELNDKNKFTKPVFDNDNNLYYIGHLVSIKDLKQTDNRFVSLDVVKNRINSSYRNSILKLFERYLFNTEKVIINETVLNNIK